jgi:hypothetical protein
VQKDEIYQRIANEFRGLKSTATREPSLWLFVGTEKNITKFRGLKSTATREPSLWLFVGTEKKIAAQSAIGSVLL